MRRVIAMALLLALAAACKEDPHRHPEVALKDNLTSMRKAIDNFYAEKQRFPHSLSELVPNYLRRIPADPVTGSAKTWIVVTEEAVAAGGDFTTAPRERPKPGITDVRSGAPGSDDRGIRYADY